MILVLDEGTSSTRALLFQSDGRIAATEQQAIASTYPRPGRVEQDAHEIWRVSETMMGRAVAAAGGAERIAAIGITNQRETLVAWDRDSGRALAPAIVWQDRRTADFCYTLKEEGHEARVQATTGLLLDPYFSASKMRWMLDELPDVRSAADAGRLAFGTIDSWLLFKLTGAHVTDASNASRTALMDLADVAWSDEMADLFGVPLDALPEIVPTAGDLGTTTRFGAPIAIRGSAGDQQAATVGQGCRAPGTAKATFGTGLFALAATGATIPASDHRLLATLLTDMCGTRSYALEGAVFAAGNIVQWLRDMAGLVDSAAETEKLARSVADNGGVTIVPAFTGLGAPHWRSDLAGSIHGLTFGVTRAHLVRAALEAVTMSCLDLAGAFEADDASWARLRVDGGMIANDWLAQDLADMLHIAVERPANVESSARGAAMLAMVGAGEAADLGDAAAALMPPVQTFEPTMSSEARAVRRAQWDAAMERALR